MNSFVPSRGSTNQNWFQCFLMLYSIFFSSSERMGMLGVSFFSLLIIILLEVLSAAVNGDRLSLSSMLIGLLVEL